LFGIQAQIGYVPQDVENGYLALKQQRFLSSVRFIVTGQMPSSFWIRLGNILVSEKIENVYVNLQSFGLSCSSNEKHAESSPDQWNLDEDSPLGQLLSEFLQKRFRDQEETIVEILGLETITPWFVRMDATPIQKVETLSLDISIFIPHIHISESSRQ
jgi:hypothetical protein